MERVLTESEKIKKAQDIYNRRNINSVSGVRVASKAVNSKPKKSAIKKMLIQICICVVLYAILYLVQNSNYIFSQPIIQKVNEILNYDLSFQEKIKELFDLGKNKYAATFEIEEIPVSATVEENTENIEEAITESYIEDASSLNQMREDAENISGNYSLEMPLKGEVTSEFGLRTIEPKFHTGIDIGAEEGKEIIAAVDGKVTLASSEGEYGNHLKIENSKLTTLYAHCLELCVAEGQNVEKGQKIATVGETGNATGPHLHFEIMYDGRYVNPKYVLDF